MTTTFIPPDPNQHTRILRWTITSTDTDVSGQEVSGGEKLAGPYDKGAALNFNLKWQWSHDGTDWGFLELSETTDVATGFKRVWVVKGFVRPHVDTFGTGILTAVFTD